MIQTLRIYLNYVLNFSIPILVFTLPLSVYYSHKIVDFLIPIWFITIDYKKLFHIIKQSRLLQSILLLTAIIFLSYLWSNHSESDPYWHRKYSDIAWYFSNYFKYFLFPILLIITNLKKEFITHIINIFLFSMFINEIISYGIVFEFWTTRYGTPLNPIPFHINHITYSTFVGFAILLSVYKFAHIKNYALRIFYLIFLITMSINLFMSAGRTGQFSLFITSIVLILIYFRKDFKILILSVFILLSSFYLAYNNMQTFNTRINLAINEINDIRNGIRADTSLGTRVLAMDTIPYLMNKDNILFGVGMGDKPNYVSETVKKDYPHRLMNFDQHGMLHNSHVEMLVSNGLIGLLFYFSIFFILFFIKIKDKFIKYTAQTTSIYFLCYGMVADIFFFKQIMLLFALLLAIIIVQSAYDSNPEISHSN